MSAGGGEVELRHGGYVAVVTEVGGGVRRLTYDGRDLVRSYPADGIRPKYRGALLAPWPNRVVDGKYTFDGEELQLDISEPERGHALHGLVVWERFDVSGRSDGQVTLSHSIVPRVGYPFSVAVRAEYHLSDDGLRCTVTARNTGDRPAPYGTAPHPYLLGGPGLVDDWTLELPAAKLLEVSPDRLVPRAVCDVQGTPFDFRTGRQVASTELDHAYTALDAAEDGLARVRVTGRDGTGAQIHWDPAVMPWVQIHTADLPDPQQSRRGLAVEPMTCPPDAFNSGQDLVVLEPGASHQATWTISALT